MSIFRALATEVLDPQFKSYVIRHKAEIAYCKHRSCRWDEKAALDPFDELAIMTHDLRRIGFTVGTDGDVKESSKITITTHTVTGSPDEIKVIDLADPGIDPVPEIRRQIRDFILCTSGPRETGRGTLDKSSQG